MLTTLKSKSAPRIVGLIDVGTAKITCMIVANEPGAHLRVIGLGQQRSQGVKAGVIVNMEQAEYAVRAAVSMAERAAGLQIGEVCVAVSCGRLRSSHFAASVDVAQHSVRGEDIDRLMNGARAYAERDGRRLVHLNEVATRLDGLEGSAEPKGLACRELAMDVHAVTADESPLRSLVSLIDRCDLRVAGLVAAPYASALATTSEQERAFGVTCIDIGAGKTSAAVFADGKFLYTDAIAIGGDHVSFDIARALSTDAAQAERIKTLYGSMLVAASDSYDVFSYPCVVDGEESLHQATKEDLGKVIRPRMESILTLMKDRLAQADIASEAGSRVVLTGGAAQLIGLGEFAADLLERPVRIARTASINGVPLAAGGAAFATIAGLVGAVNDARAGVTVDADRQALEGGMIDRVGAWVRSGF